MNHHPQTAAWIDSPWLHIKDGIDGNEYRLAEGRIEFRPADGERWRSLAYPEIQQHMVLGTPVAKWLSQLYSTAKLARVLSSS